MANIVYIADTAFMAILVSSIEAFPSKYEGRRKPKGVPNEGEVYGLLFGHHMTSGAENVYHISIAVPMQIVSMRSEDSVTPSVRHSEKIKSVIELFPMYQYVGSFHSHPYRKNEYGGIRASRFSDADKELALVEAMDYKEILELIIGITHLSRAPKKAPQPYWHCIENYCGKYKYSLSAYITNTADQELVEVDNLICPFAAGIGNYDLKRS